MNLLAHAFLSFGDKDILCGNMMGDFIKGKKILDTFPDKIKTGILLHRKIDQFTDNHPSVIMARNIFKPDYHLYAGPIIDILFDHFLANDPKYFQNEKRLLDFTQNVYQQLAATKEYQTEEFKRLCMLLGSKNILFNYRNIGGLKTALYHLCKRMRIDKTNKEAVENAMRYYNELNQYYFDLMDNILIFAKKELIS